MMKRLKNQIIAVFAVTIIVFIGYEIYVSKNNLPDKRNIKISSDSKACVKCHGYGDGKGGPGLNPGIVKGWESSLHAEHGVGCLDCHGFEKKKIKKEKDNPLYIIEMKWDKQNNIKSEKLIYESEKPKIRPDIWEHKGKKIVTNVTPRTCGACHGKEKKEFFYSRHSSAGQLTGSIENSLANSAEGIAADNSGCQQCHGSRLIIEKPADKNSPPAFASNEWPNTGIGRINLDGSWGSCSACHSRHEFSLETARRPDNCGKCHTGPAHPQLEVYYGSKHGIAYKKHEGELSFGKGGKSWILGKNYYEAPTCSTCHMGDVNPNGEYSGLRNTHEVGSRISWDLRSKISTKTKRIISDNGKVISRHPEQRRNFMKQVCFTCHSDSWVNNFYTQFDEAVDLYNEKYAKPAGEIYEYLHKEGIVDDIPMNEKMDYLYFELWHHEGRRARHGAAMMGPDYVQWQGFYELSKNFYTKFLPLAQKLGEQKGKGKETTEFIYNILHEEGNWEKYHRWMEYESSGQKEEAVGPDHKNNK